MNTTLTQLLKQSLAIAAAAALLACADEAPPASRIYGPNKVQLATLPGTETDGAIATLQRVTARYHDLNVATSPEEGFVLLHPCEARPGEGPVGVVYFNPTRLLDGVIDPEKPDALIYEPARNGERPRLVGVEFAIPYALAPNQQPPTFLGATFQSEEEFGVFALHVWVWRNNPEGLFAETNPNVSCGEA
jgi:hypothetical protein